MEIGSFITEPFLEVGKVGAEVFFKGVSEIANTINQGLTQIVGNGRSISKKNQNQDVNKPKQEEKEEDCSPLLEVTNGMEGVMPQIFG